MKVWIWYCCQNRIENYYQQDEEQLGFYKKVHIKTHSMSKKKDILVILHRKKNEWVLIYLIKTVLKKTSNCIFNMEKGDLEEL